MYLNYKQTIFEYQPTLYITQKINTKLQNVNNKKTEFLTQSIPILFANRKCTGERNDT